MVVQYIQSLRKQRGRYPVSNLAGDYLFHAHTQPFLLGDWLGLMGLSELEDIQCKIEQFLAGGGPDHAAEDLVACVGLVSMAETGGQPESAGLTAEQTMQRLKGWHEANMLEKLRRRELVYLTAGLSIDPAVPRGPRFHFSVAPALVERFATA